VAAQAAAATLILHSCTARTNQWTAKIGGKAVTRRLSEHQASLYKQWIGNDRPLRAIITQMRQVAAQATELLLNEAADPQGQSLNPSSERV
jgi:hypothetical protein